MTEQDNLLDRLERTLHRLEMNWFMNKYVDNYAALMEAARLYGDETPHDRWGSRNTGRDWSYTLQEIADRVDLPEHVVRRFCYALIGPRAGEHAFTPQTSMSNYLRDAACRYMRDLATEHPTMPTEAIFRRVNEFVPVSKLRVVRFLKREGLTETRSEADTYFRKLLHVRMAKGLENPEPSDEELEDWYLARSY